MLRYLKLFLLCVLLSACSLTTPPSAPPPSRPAPIPKPQPVPDKVPAPQPAPPRVEQVPADRPSPAAPAAKQYQLTPASKALVSQAKTLSASGDFPVALSTIERALRIEPSNPLLWIELGKVHQASGNYPQAEHTARKALSLAAYDLRTQSAAWQLIAQSLRARGRVQQGQEAQARADALMPD